MLIFDIKRYAINDGPGIRITIFLKGCPLSCVWCHNPEGVSPRQNKLYTISRCIACKRCIGACPHGALSESDHGIVTDVSKCTLCGKCALICPARAMEMSAKNMTLEQVMKEIEKEKPFFEPIATGENGTSQRGGVTVCGGEPLMHPDDLLSILVACGRENIHRVVDTTLYASPETVKKVASECELFLVDLKMMDSEKHKRYCGVPNEIIHSNIALLADLGKDFIIRIPLVEGINADEENIRTSAKFLAGVEKWKSPQVEILPYHDIAKGKHTRMGTIYNPEGIPMSTPDSTKIAQCISIFAEYGIEARS